MIIDHVHQIELEITTKCNAKCPQCVRNYFGSYTWPSLPILDMDLNWFKQAISTEVWINLAHIKFCGTYGDPCMHKDLLEFVKFVKQSSSAAITINTNGGIRSKTWWKSLAEVLDPEKDKVFFGIDGLEDTNHLYRIDVNFAKVIENLKAFNRAGGNSIWTFLVFEHNQHQVELARELSKQLGCKNFVFKSTSRFVNKAHQLVDYTPVLDNAGQQLYVIKPAAELKYKNTGYDDIAVVDQQYQGYGNYLKSAKIECKAQKQQGVYISAEGDVFPCGWLSDRMYGFEAEAHQDHQTLMSVINSIGGRTKINLHYSKLEDIIYGAWFQSIEQSWETNKLQRCALLCGDKSTLIQKANVETINVWSGPAKL